MSTQSLFLARGDVKHEGGPEAALDFARVKRSYLRFALIVNSWVCGFR
jgi:hypothetical protein